MYEGKYEGKQATAMTYAGDSATVAKRTGHISAQIEELHRLSERATDLLARVDDRVSPILMIEPPGVLGHGSNEMPDPDVPLANTLRVVNRRLDTLCARLDNILNRIEL